MRKRVAFASVPALCAVFGTSLVHAQRGGGDWTTSGFDAQRSGWVRGDAKISPETMGKPGFEQVWKLDLKEAARERDPLTPPVLLDFYIGYRGFRSLAFFGNSADTVVAVDTDLSRVEWKRNLGTGKAAARATPACPAGMTAGLARTTSIGYQNAQAARGFGRSNPAKSGVGEPLQGAVTLKADPPPSPFPPPAPANATGTNPRRTAAAPNLFAPRVQYVYAISSDGKLHSLYVSNGEEPKPAVDFLPPNANAQGLLVFDNVAYVTTSGDCNSVENGVWALDLQTQKVSHWKAKGKGPAGSAGLAAGPDGTIYVTDGGDLVALEERTLTAKNTFSLDNAQFTSTPVIFDHKGKDMLAVVSSDGRLHVFDTTAMSKPVVSSAAFTAANTPASQLASWQDTNGARWILAPASGAAAAGAGFKANGDVKTGSIVAWKLADENGSVSLQPGWMSREIASPLAPIIVNGVVFAASGTGKGNRAVLYALDGATGKELWSSAEAISGPVRRGGLSSGGSRVYVATQEGTQYAFSFPIEH